MKYLPFHIGRLEDEFVAMMGDYTLTGDSEDELREKLTAIYGQAKTRAQKARLPAVVDDPGVLGPGWAFLKVSD